MYTRTIMYNYIYETGLLYAYTFIYTCKLDGIYKKCMYIVVI